MSPGGGQVGLVTPPPPPPPDPDPIVVQVSDSPGVAAVGAVEEDTEPAAQRASMRQMHKHAVVLFEREADLARTAARSNQPRPTSQRAVLRSIVLRFIVSRLLAESPVLVVDG